MWGPTGMGERLHGATLPREMPDSVQRSTINIPHTHDELALS